LSFCPSCQSPIEILDQHKGTLFTCPQCSAVYFVDWNGLPEQAGEVAESQEPPHEESDFISVPTGTEGDPNLILSTNFDLAPFAQTESIDNESSFDDVTQFANSNSQVGSLAYTLMIEGIDSNALIAELREALTDSRFGWDVDGILESLKSERLVIKSISPAKASVLINRIKYLPLKISWGQDVFSSV
jgi:hypothetical protein